MKVYLVCGVPGSGKTWVCEQLANSYNYVPHDDHIEGDLVAALKSAADARPLLTECPFAERELKSKLENAGFEVVPYFIVEPTSVVQERYLGRTGKPLPQACVTRSVTIANRAAQWSAPKGTATEVLEMLRQSRFQNSKGTVYYGMHFYPGVAEYVDASKGTYRVFLNEDTIRKMGPSFVGRPVFVQHVDGVDESVDNVRHDADGWVVESFFNQADGKHWVKFIVCSERGERAIKAGMRLSNCYLPTDFGEGGLWNGVSYQKEVKGGEYEHLAIVPNPRYEESVILSPEQFKAYNESKVLELNRLANNKDEGADKVKFKLFQRQKIENSIDLEGTIVVLEKTKREVTLSQLCIEADERLTNAQSIVDVDGTKMTLGELLAKHKEVSTELATLKNAKDKDKDAVENEDDDKDEDDKDKTENDDDDDMDDESMENEDDEAKAAAIAKAKADEAADKKKNKKKNALSPEAKAAARAAAERLENAPHNIDKDPPTLYTSDDGVARGKSRYGS